MAPEATRELPTNEDGFVWRSNNRTAVVEDEWPEGGRVVWENGEVDEFALSTEPLRDGLNDE